MNSSFSWPSQLPARWCHSPGVIGSGLASPCGVAAAQRDALVAQQLELPRVAGAVAERLREDRPLRGHRRRPDPRGDRVDAAEVGRVRHGDDLPARRGELVPAAVHGGHQLRTRAARPVVAAARAVEHAVLRRIVEPPVRDQRRIGRHRLARAVDARELARAVDRARAAGLDPGRVAAGHRRDRRRRCERLGHREAGGQGGELRGGRRTPHCDGATPRCHGRHQARSLRRVRSRRRSMRARSLRTRSAMSSNSVSCEASPSFCAKFMTRTRYENRLPSSCSRPCFSTNSRKPISPSSICAHTFLRACRRAAPDAAPAPRTRCGSPRSW